jgi:predicted RNA-binding Zn ribbon-like protein
VDVAHLTGGGAPLLGEPPPIELGNTTYAVRGRLKEGLETVGHLAAWLRDMRPRLGVTLTDDDLRGVTADDLALARELRDTIRALDAASSEGRLPHPDVVTTLNRHAGRTPRWRELRTEPQPHATGCTAGRPVEAALAALAEEAVDLFAGRLRQDVRGCRGPGCVLFFVRDSPRREFCSAGCANRARAARHYARSRRAGAGPPTA